MRNAKILFTKGRGIDSFLIRKALMSDFNHVGIEIDGVVYDSAIFKGVRKQSADAFRKRNEVKIALEITLPDKDAALRFLEDQLGKEYDIAAILSLPFKRDWHDDSKWMCSELVAETLVKSGLNVPINANRVTPRDLLFVTISGEHYVINN